MEFNKIILGEDERVEFENLLLREKIIDSVQQDFCDLVDMNDAFLRARTQRVSNKRRLIIFLMLFEKFDAENISIYNLSRLIDLGIIDKESCISLGTDINHPTSKIIDTMLMYKRLIISIVLKATDSILKKNGLVVYSKSLISEEILLDLCDCYLRGTRQDFYTEYVKDILIILNNYNRRQYDGYNMIYGYEINTTSCELGKINDDILSMINSIYNKLGRISCNYGDVLSYYNFNEKLDTNIQKYQISDLCLSCVIPWEKCCNNSEFFYGCSFECPQREKLGEQRYAKLNGLIMSHMEHATLFDNSIKFRNTVVNTSKIIDDIYYVVNVDLAPFVASLPVPHTVAEALRLRRKEEIQSFRKIFLQWADYLYNGDVDEAEYIRKDFDVANKFFERQNLLQNKKKMLLRCCFEALGNQIPYISNVVGAVSPFLNRKTLLEEEKHKWLLLTR